MVIAHRDEAVFFLYDAGSELVLADRRSQPKVPFDMPSKFDQFFFLKTYYEPFQSGTALNHKIM